MVDYTIQMLDESDITISGGGVLDGVNQGNGRHLVGLDITLNSSALNAINVSDNDTNFGDSDSSQVLNGAQTIDGVTYASGTVVEAEFAISVTDGVNIWTFIAFNVNNSWPAYGTVEGLAFINDPLIGPPPIGVPLTVLSNSEGPNYTSTLYDHPICFTSGTLIATPSGERLVEHLTVGDKVVTADNGAQTIRWIGVRTVNACGSFAPVLIKAGTLGNVSDLSVSQQHRMLVSGWRAELLYGTDEILVPATKLCNDDTIRIHEGGTVTYVHILFDDHQIVFANGAKAESFHPGEQALSSLDQAAREEIFALFPELRHDAGSKPFAKPVIADKTTSLLI